ncbi:MAG: mannonate dehydratase [Victivallales bacterium]|jgi:mannonate dehydratase|nr:mannonate dehydratase [Victivallales bacterium]
MFMQESFRWYGPSDGVPLSFIRQAGAEGVVTSLHHIPYGELWSEEEIRKRQNEVSAAGMVWNVVESLPVHEDIKVRSGDYKRRIENFRQSLRNLGKCGLKIVTYNFMPVLDWVRTDLRYRLPDGSETLYFNNTQFAAFELFLLQRPGAENDYDSATYERAKKFYDSMSPSVRDAFCKGIIDNFPGCLKGVTLNDIRKMLSRYKDMGRAELVGNFKDFLDAVIPVAEESSCQLVIHPDDPPRSILGLPRFFCNQNDLAALLALKNTCGNGICFCAGSLSANPANDIVAMFKSCASRVGFVHLRSTQPAGDGNFYEANHLSGSVDMYELVKAIIDEQLRRKDSGRADYRIPIRPDHGPVMLDDLSKDACDNPGYSAIGRLKGLAELRGLEYGILRSCYPEVWREFSTKMREKAK